jgi:hypothetical protein
MGKNILFGIRYQITWRSSLFPIGSLNELFLLVHCSSSNIILQSTSVKGYWRVAEKCIIFAKPSNIICLFTEIYWSVDEDIVKQSWESVIQ